MSCLPSLLEIIEKSNLHGGLRQVYVALVAYAERYGAPISPSLTALAKASDISRRQVIRCLQQLMRQGYVTLIRRHDPRANAKNLYLVQCPWQDEKPLLKTGDMAILKTGDTRARVGFKTQDKREKKEQTGDIPPGNTTRQIPPEVMNYPKHIDWVNRNLTPGSVAYAAALSDATPDPVHQADRLAAFQESDADVWHPRVEPGPGRGVGWRYYVGI
jgi:DNA-binding transcriptional MocR family regulator